MGWQWCWSLTTSRRRVALPLAASVASTFTMLFTKESPIIFTVSPDGEQLASVFLVWWGDHPFQLGKGERGHSDAENWTRKIVLKIQGMFRRVKLGKIIQMNGWRPRLQAKKDYWTHAEHEKRRRKRQSAKCHKKEGNIETIDLTTVEEDWSGTFALDTREQRMVKQGRFFIYWPCVKTP